MPQLSTVQAALQTSCHGQQLLSSLAKHLSRVLPSTVTVDCQGIAQIKQAEFDAMLANDSQHTQTDAARSEGKIGLAVLMIGLWSHKVKQELAVQGNKAPLANDGSFVEAAVAADPGSSLAVASAADASIPLPASSIPSQSGYPASEAMPDGPASTDSLAASQAGSKVPTATAPGFGSWVDHMTMLASDAEDEEESDAASTLCGTTRYEQIIPGALDCNGIVALS